MKREEIKIYNKNYQILIGENAKENTEIIKNCDPNDTWFHFDLISSPHIVLCNGSDIIPKIYLLQVAQLLYKYKPSAPFKTRIIYTTISNIKCTKKIGSVIVLNKMYL